jgi:hypothetical protein
MAGQNLFTNTREENFHLVAEAYTQELHYQPPKKGHRVRNSYEKTGLSASLAEGSERGVRGKS